VTYVLDLTQLAAGYPDWHIWQSQAGRWWATRVGRVAAWDTHDDPDFAMTIDADSLEQLAKELEYQTNTLLAVFALPFWPSINVP
jgi:hypothetical protein